MTHWDPQIRAKANLRPAAQQENVYQDSRALLATPADLTQTGAQTSPAIAAIKSNFALLHRVRGEKGWALLVTLVDDLSLTASELINPG
jgi:hypothetical protein